MRDWSRMDAYLTSLYEDVYPQPEDKGHIGLAREFIYWMNVPSCQSVLDVGCGTGFCQPFFNKRGIAYTGICLGEDYQVGKRMGHTVIEMDYNFLEFPNNSFDMIFSRHSLEHSPFPILSLMEWHRVASKYLGLVVPNPDKYTFTGRNHYSVSNPRQIVWWLRRAGWKPLQIRLFQSEFWFVCENRPVISSEGYVEEPLEHKIYAFERDDLLDYDGQTIIVEEALKKVRR